MKCYCCKCGTLCTVRGKDGNEALATVGLPEKDMNLDWYRRVRTRINGQTT